MPHKRPEKRRICQKKASAKYYAANKDKVIAKVRDTKRKLRAQWSAFKQTLCCMQCGENHPATLDFHHVVRSKGNRKVYRLVGNGMWSAVMEEIKKCVVLCSNCHRKLHHQEREDAKQARKKKVAKKLKTY